MELPGLDRFLAHDESFRAACAQIEQKTEFHAATNAEIPLPEANCVLRVRLPEARVAQFLKLAASRDLAVVVDPGTLPEDLPARLVQAGFASRGREVLAVLDPAALIEPPGPTPRFTSVGPSELPRFTELASWGAAGDAVRRLWFFRLRNLLFSAYLAQDERGAPGAFGLFHAGSMARVLGPFPAPSQTDFTLACKLVKRAWERAQEKDADLLYTCAPEAEAAGLRSLGFTLQERVWLETFVR